MFNHIFERRILRKIYGPVRDQHEEWIIRWNHELYQLYKDLPISAYARIQRLQLYGHVMRMGEERLVNRLFKRMPLGTRSKGRPKTRWKDQVHTDMKELKIQYTPDRAEWKKQLDRAKDQRSL
jgi:hypothetical protein